MEKLQPVPSTNHVEEEKSEKPGDQIHKELRTNQNSVEPVT